MSEFWLISAPGDKANLIAWDRMNTVTAKANLSCNSKFIIPDLKVGTLDALVGLSDELGKLDSFAESVIKKIAQYIGEVMEDSKDKVQENLLANGGVHSGRSDIIVLSCDQLGGQPAHSSNLAHEANPGKDLVCVAKKTFHTREIQDCKVTLSKLRETLGKEIQILQGNKFHVVKEEAAESAAFDLISYLMRFEWDMAKYPIKQPLKNISEALAKQITQIETDMKNRAAVYNNIKGNLQNLERKTVGNLLTRTLTDIVNKEDFVLNSEYLITLLVVVPKSSYVQWQKTYESLSDMVVPRSTKMITEDAEGGLFTVTLFRKVIDDFKAKARENKFMVREFYYDEKELKCEKEEMRKLASDKKQQYGPLLRWLKVNFSESFVAWIHIKALRVFSESVLRYGLPVNFQAMLIQPNKKSTKRLRDVLNAVFKHLDEVAAASIMDASMDIPGLQLSNQEYYPYVYFKIDLSILECS